MLWNRRHAGRPSGCAGRAAGFPDGEGGAGSFQGGLPWGAVAAGALLAVALVVIDRMLERRGAHGGRR